MISILKAKIQLRNGDIHNIKKHSEINIRRHQGPYIFDLINTYHFNLILLRRSAECVLCYQNRIANLTFMDQSTKPMDKK